MPVSSVDAPSDAHAGAQMWRYLRLAAGMGTEEDVVETARGEGSRGSDGDGGGKRGKNKGGKPKFKGLGKLLKKIPGSPKG
jgi:hypothetical protein